VVCNSSLTLVVKGIWSVKSWVLVCWWWRFYWSSALYSSTCHHHFHHP